MIPNQAKGVETEANPIFSSSVQREPIELANSTLLPKPKIKVSIPC